MRAISRHRFLPRMILCGVAAVLCGLGLPGTPARAADSAVADAVAIGPEQALQHVGEKCVVTMTVASGRLMADEGRCYLNSHKNFRDKENLSVVIFRSGLDKFAAVEIADPAEHFRDRTIRVTGTVELFKDKPQIKVGHPDQVEVVPAADEAATTR